jgi:hypothetical protein
LAEGGIYKIIFSTGIFAYKKTKVDRKIHPRTDIIKNRTECIKHFKINGKICLIGQKEGSHFLLPNER